MQLFVLHKCIDTFDFDTVDFYSQHSTVFEILSRMLRVQF